MLKGETMLYLGIIIALGSMLAFLAIGALTLMGGVDTTRAQIIPGFKPDQPGPGERILTLLGLWGPALFAALLCLLGAIQILRVALAAIS